VWTFVPRQVWLKSGIPVTSSGLVENSRRLGVVPASLAADREVTMRKIGAAALIIIIFFPIKLDADGEQAPVRITMVNEAVSGAGSERDCIVIYANDDYHVERRHQSPSSHSADRIVFESYLTPDELRLLDNHLSQ
jgi:hypothetical protein